MFVVKKGLVVSFFLSKFGNKFALSSIFSEKHFREKTQMKRSNFANNFSAVVTLIDVGFNLMMIL